MAYNKNTQQWEQDDLFKERRFGRIDIASHFYENDINVLHHVFSLLIPVEVSYDYAMQLFKIKGLAKQFEPVELGNQMPYYQVIIHNNEKNNEIDVEFKKV